MRLAALVALVFAVDPVREERLARSGQGFRGAALGSRTPDLRITSDHDSVDTTCYQELCSI